jgi:hypothetical protein
MSASISKLASLIKKIPVGVIGINGYFWVVSPKFSWCVREDLTINLEIRYDIL